MKPMTIAERLGTVAYRNQGRSQAKAHIEVDTAICNSRCPHKCTTYVCPANCYTLDEEGQVHFQFEDCIECGACAAECPVEAIYPDDELPPEDEKYIEINARRFGL